MKTVKFVALGLLLMAGAALAASGNVQQYNAICNPNTGGTGLQCLLPDASGSLPVVNGAPPSTFYTGQIIIAVTGTEVCLPSHSILNGLVVKARSANAANGFVGPTGVTRTDDGTGNGYRILPGEAWAGAVSDSSAVCVNGTANDIFYYSGN